MQTRFSKKAKVFDIGVTAVAAVLSVGIMLFGVFHFGLGEAWPELILNLFYIACLAMMWMYFFNSPRITTQQFNYWSSVCGYDGFAARHSFRATVGLLLAPLSLFHALRSAHPHAHFFLRA